MEAFDPDREEVVARAFGAGLEAILCPADLTVGRSLEIILDLRLRPPRILAAAGVHPHQARLFDPDCRARLHALAAERRIAAVGEIGLDFHYHFSEAADQRLAFRTQLGIAKDLGLPVIVHSRNAGVEILEAVSEAGLTRGGVLHCFSETWEIAGKALDLGFTISFSGILTFPGAANLRDVARKVPAGRLLVETDSPYLAPVPFRGKVRRNEPAWVAETAKVLAGLRNESLEELAAVTTGNFKTLFSV
ncbi:MAG: TatD family hydrolase [Candidatus Aminicenantes bacterium]|nr:TatD family hydrolase [Candidatus Aminicenantes bacterium]